MEKVLRMLKGKKIFIQYLVNFMLLYKKICRTSHQN